MSDAIFCKKHPRIDPAKNYTATFSLDFLVGVGGREPTSEGKRVARRAFPTFEVPFKSKAAANRIELEQQKSELPCVVH